MTTWQIIVGFIVSTVGFSIFLFGKKQRRSPQLVAGALMMASPFLLRDPIWLTVAAVLMLVGARVAVRYGV